MKLDIEAMIHEANNLANVAIVGNSATHEGWDRERMKAFARLIVERCAVAVEGRHMGDHNREDAEVKRCAATIRQLLEDK